MWVERRVEDAVERKVETEGMGDDARGGWGVCTRREWRDGRSRETRSNYGAVGRENGRSGVGWDPEVHAGRRRRGDMTCGERDCIDVHQMRGDGTAARRDGGELVRAAAGAGRAPGEGCGHRVVAVDAAEGGDGAAVETGLDEYVAAEGTQVWVLRRCAPEAELAPVLTRKLARVWVGLGRRENAERDGHAHTQAGKQRREQLDAGRNGRGKTQEGGVAAVRMQGWTGVPVQRRVRGGAARETGAGVHGGRARSTWARGAGVDADRDGRVETEMRARSMPHGGSGADAEQDGRVGRTRGRGGCGTGWAWHHTGGGRDSGVDAEQYGWRGRAMRACSGHRGSGTGMTWGARRRWQGGTRSNPSMQAGGGSGSGHVVAEGVREGQGRCLRSMRGGSVGSVRYF
ncbi:hypothetical protein DFH08DRAFT_938334 [Mycena albidolilacea]|uniref:Uncharacterized protein n=1 Tax=Mycena albidolilacea TaxID=1033008 RepID=A0AAD6ZVH0_9AGAR|nr:hypothetical protein DFH08DRAFT_938334 [Mycena albidolilacea]